MTSGTIQNQFRQVLSVKMMVRVRRRLGQDEFYRVNGIAALLHINRLPMLESSQIAERITDFHCGGSGGNRLSPLAREAQGPKVIRAQQPSINHLNLFGFNVSFPFRSVHET